MFEALHTRTRRPSSQLPAFFRTRLCVRRPHPLTAAGMSSDDARSALVSLRLSSLRLDADSNAQLHELEWHPRRAMLATADVEGVVSFYHMRKPTHPRARMRKRATHSALGEARDDSSSSSAAAALQFGGHVQAARLTHHQDSVRSITFHPSGEYAYSASADKSIGIIDMNTLQLSSQLHSAHDAGINRVSFYNEHLLVSGDDDGFVHVWDLRAHNMGANVGSAAAASAASAAAGKAATAAAKSSSAAAAARLGSKLHPLLRYEDAGDYISDILPVPQHNRLIITSGDGHLYVYDMRAGHIHEQVSRALGTKSQPKPKALGKSKAAQKKKLTPSGFLAPGGQATDTWFAMSDDVCDELSGAVLLKGGRKLVAAGREEGVLNVFKWDYFGAPEDHFHLGASRNELEGSGASIDCLLKIDEDTLLTGSTDGLLRLVQLHPNKLLGIIGTHEDSFPIECMKMSPQREGYWDTALPALKEQEDESSDEGEEDGEEEGEDAEEDEEGSSSGGGGSKGKSSFIATSRDADTDAAVEDAEAESFASLSSRAGCGLQARFLASSSHDGVVKFWNCAELYEVDPDDPVAEDDDEDDDAAGNDEGSDAEGAGAAESDADSDDDAASAKKKQAKASKSNAKAKAEPGVKKEDEDGEDDEDEDGEDAEDEDAEQEISDTSDSAAGSGQSSDEDSEAGAGKSSKPKPKHPKLAAAAAQIKSAALNLFARVAPSTAAGAADAAAPPTAASAAAPVAAASSASAAAPVKNLWQLVAPATAYSSATAGAKAKGKVAAGASSDDDSMSDGDSSDDGGKKRKKKSDKDHNASTSFFANLPASHPMHPSQAHKRAAKAPLKLEKDNIALRPAKKRAALQEKLAQRREKASRLEARRAEAAAKGEDPALLELSSDEEQRRKRRKGAGGKRVDDSDDDDDDDDDEDEQSGAGSSSKAKPQKERKMTPKERKAAKKLEKQKNPFFDGM